MVKLLLSCDQSVILYKGEYYARNKERFDFFNRYIRIFDSLRIVVRCVESDEYSPSWIKIQNPKIEIVFIPTYSGPINYLKVYRKIGILLSSVVEDCDAAIIRIPSSLGQRVAHKVMKKGIPYAVEVVYDAEDGANNSKTLFERLIWKCMDKDMRSISYNASGVSCVTEHFLQRHYYSKRKDAFVSHYSSLSLDNTFYTSPKMYPKGKVFSIVHVANQVDCSTRKGHIQLVSVLRILKDKKVRVSLTFVGSDYHDGINQLKRLSKDLRVDEMINFTGRVEREELSSLLEKADMFVFPTAAEGLPRVVIEAMAKGLPCVISNVSGNPELVSEDLLVDYKDIDTMADKIIKLIDNPTYYENVSKANFERSLCYEASILEKRRDEFYTKLKCLTKK